MCVYSNDGFTVTEALVQATPGKSYIEFVQDEILMPLGMDNTRFTTSAFPAGSYAKACVKGVVQPQEFVHVLASGGALSTAKDMAQIAMMFLATGADGGRFRRLGQGWRCQRLQCGDRRFTEGATRHRGDWRLGLRLDDLNMVGRGRAQCGFSAGGERSWLHDTFWRPRTG
jgi:CubicO group peptidase (beta-lactamase class C family)